MSKKQRFNKKKWLKIAGISLLVVAVPLIINATTYVPGVAVGRFFIHLKGGAKPTARYNEIKQDVKVVKDVVVNTENAPPAKLDIYVPKGQSAVSYPIILWIHGGGFIGSGKADTAVFSTLLAHEGFVVASLEFTRPPDARYPVPIRQANATLGYLSQHAATYQGDPSRIFVAGNSSGAQIASQTVAVETDPRLAKAMHLQPALPPSTLRGVALYSGGYDMITAKKIHFPFLRVGLWAYTGYRDWTKFPDIDQLSTVHHVTDVWPPTFITAGDIDPLEPQSLEFAPVLHKHGVPVTELFWHGSGRKLDHDYQFDLSRPEAQAAFQKVVNFLHNSSKEKN